MRPWQLQLIKKDMDKESIVEEEDAHHICFCFPSKTHPLKK